MTNYRKLAEKVAATYLQRTAKAKAKAPVQSKPINPAAAIAAAAKSKKLMDRITKTYQYNIGLLTRVQNLRVSPAQAAKHKRTYMELMDDVEQLADLAKATLGKYWHVAEELMQGGEDFDSNSPEGLIDHTLAELLHVVQGVSQGNALDSRRRYLSDSGQKNRVFKEVYEMAEWMNLPIQALAKALQGDFSLTKNLHGYINRRHASGSSATPAFDQLFLKSDKIGYVLAALTKKIHLLADKVEDASMAGQPEEVLLWGQRAVEKAYTLFEPFRAMLSRGKGELAAIQDAHQDLAVQATRLYSAVRDDLEGSYRALLGALHTKDPEGVVKATHSLAMATSNVRVNFDRLWALRSKL